MEKVLVVDDAPTIRALVTNMVYRLGFHAVGCESGSQAIEAAYTMRPRVVLMDMHMQGMQGDAACRVLKKMLNATPVVMMTSTDKPDEIRACHRAGADDFLPKPIHRNQLASKLTAITSPPQPQVSRKQSQVVLVDSDPKHRDLVASALEYSGYTAFPVRAALEVFGCAQGKSIDLLVIGASIDAVDAELAIAGALKSGCSRVLRLTAKGSPDPSPPNVSGAHITVLRAAFAEEVVEKANGMLKRITPDLRESQRRPFFSVAHFRKPGTEDWLSGYTSDLSDGGLCLRTLSPMEPMTDVEIKLALPGSQEEVLSGMVAWTRPFQPRPFRVGAPGMGVKFIHPEPKVIQRLTTAHAT